MPRINEFDTDGQAITLSAHRGDMTIDFKNLIIGRHESKVLFMWNPKEGRSSLGHF